MSNDVRDTLVRDPWSVSDDDTTSTVTFDQSWFADALREGGFLLAETPAAAPEMVVPTVATTTDAADAGELDEASGLRPSDVMPAAAPTEIVAVAEPVVVDEPREPVPPTVPVRSDRSVLPSWPRMTPPPVAMSPASPDAPARSGPSERSVVVPSTLATDLPPTPPASLAARIAARRSPALTPPDADATPTPLTRSAVNVPTTTVAPPVPTLVTPLSQVPDAAPRASLTPVAPPTAGSPTPTTSWGLVAPRALDAAAALETPGMADASTVEAAFTEDVSATEVLADFADFVDVSETEVLATFTEVDVETEVLSTWTAGASEADTDAEILADFVDVSDVEDTSEVLGSWETNDGPVAIDAIMDGQLDTATDDRVVALDWPTPAEDASAWVMAPPEAAETAGPADRAGFDVTTLDDLDHHGIDELHATGSLERGTIDLEPGSIDLGPSSIDLEAEAPDLDAASAEADAVAAALLEASVLDPSVDVGSSEPVGDDDSPTVRLAALGLAETVAPPTPDRGSVPDPFMASTVAAGSTVAAASPLATTRDDAMVQAFPGLTTAPAGIEVPVTRAPTGGAEPEASEGDLWALVGAAAGQDKATAVPRATRLASMALTALVALVIVVLVIGFVVLLGQIV